MPAFNLFSNSIKNNSTNDLAQKLADSISEWSAGEIAIAASLTTLGVALIAVSLYAIYDCCKNKTSSTDGHEHQALLR